MNFLLIIFISIIGQGFSPTGKSFNLFKGINDFIKVASIHFKNLKQYFNNGTLKIVLIKNS